jgi:hypothetical protein
MNITVDNEQEILQEGVAVLIEHLGTSKTARFLSAWKQGAGDYLKLREQLFQGETVDSLYEKIVAYEKSQSD